MELRHRFIHKISASHHLQLTSNINSSLSSLQDNLRECFQSDNNSKLSRVSSSIIQRHRLFSRLFLFLVITTSAFGPDPMCLTCPSCQKPITSQIDYESSTKTHLMAGLICLLFWPCFCLPYLMDSCKNANHYCPHCRAYLGSFRSN